jgi:hypothetical protein
VDAEARPAARSHPVVPQLADGGDLSDDDPFEGQQPAPKRQHLAVAMETQEPRRSVQNTAVAAL